MKDRIIYLTVMFLAPLWADASGLTISSETDLLIVTGEKPSKVETEASQVLQRNLQLLTDRKFALLREDLLAGHQHSILILVGQTELEKDAPCLKPEEVYIKVSDDRLILRGGDINPRTGQECRGTVFAVYELLEKFCGMRWLWPGKSGRVVPLDRNFSLQSMTYRYQPAIGQRKIRNPLTESRSRLGAEALGIAWDDYVAHWKSTKPWFAAQKLGSRLNLRYGHAFGDYWEEYGDKHPEWFALQPDGTRDQSSSPDRARFCVSNRKLIDETSRRKIQEIRSHPDRDSVSLCPNDGGKPAFCMCTECQKFDVKDGPETEIRGWGNYYSLSDRYVWFANQVAKCVTKECPEALFGFYAYSVYSNAPLNTRLHPSLVVGFVPGTYFHEDERKALRQQWSHWREMGAKRIFWRPNCFHHGHGFPAVYVRRMGADLKYFAENGLIATDFDSCLHHWATQGLNYYVTAKLLWNPEKDVDEIVSDYCNKGFRQAAPQIKTYFNEVENLTCRMAANNTGGNIKDKFRKSAPGFYLAFLPEANKILRKARRQAEGDSKVLKRIAFLKTGLRYAEAQAKAFQFLNNNWRKWHACDEPANRKILDDRYEMLMDISRTELLAVNVVKLTWRDHGYWKYTGWKWPHERGTSQRNQ